LLLEYKIGKWYLNPMQFMYYLFLLSDKKQDAPTELKLSWSKFLQTVHSYGVWFNKVPLGMTCL